MFTYELSPLGETAVRVVLGTGIDPDIHRKVKTLSEYLDRNPFPGMIEYIPSFSSVTVLYNPMESSFDTVSVFFREASNQIQESTQYVPKTVEIPVCYGGEFGPDLEFVAEQNGLSVEEVIKIHSEAEYLVYMIGFAPGFPYLGGMSERIATPRRSSPRISIPAGSVGIAGSQTGVYPIETPGGWQLIGRTPLALFRPNESPPSLLQAGDVIRFRPITLEEYKQYGRNG
ncbi:5-oxoprolinase subunit PxpB [Ammoniphilus sp. YIM 78166]|uniref:5-oxoprolinase subunit PxpB n=1 Tax=Ammoniphilus sp. YIM 78166 TaxID=1644106 RepID=UPI00106FB9F0|nr:5-oxoprolinase subunit PxpB [Ammoniphilus sp. YIM 78166]